MLGVRLRALVTWVAIYAVALNAILMGLAPIGANASVVDPFSVICHNVSTVNAAGDESPDKPGLIPGHGCQHCNLCSVTPPPTVSASALDVDFTLARVLQVLRPVPVIVRAGATSDPKLARGPPQAA